MGTQAGVVIYYAIAFGAGAFTVVALGVLWVRLVNRASDHLTNDRIAGE